MTITRNYAAAIAVTWAALTAAAVASFHWWTTSRGHRDLAEWGAADWLVLAPGVAVAVALTMLVAWCVASDLAPRHTVRRFQARAGR